MAKHDKSKQAFATAPDGGGVAVEPARRGSMWSERPWFDWTEPWRWLDSRVSWPFEDRLRVEETVGDGEMVVRAEIPGIDPERDVEITLDDRQLQIRAERRQTTTSTTEGRTRSEFRYGSFSRMLALPDGVDASHVEASYKDGILEVRVPVPKEPARGATRIAVGKS